MNPHRLRELLPDAAIPPTTTLGRLPTPLEHRGDLGADLGVEVLLKREDLLDDLGSGHKARKLGYVTADALSQEATVLVTGGSVPSGQCVAVASAAHRHRLGCHLVYSGDAQVRPARPQGSYLLALLFETRVTWHERTSWTLMDDLLETAADDERRRGERPYVVRPGIADWPGLLGSVDLGLELAEQLAQSPGDAREVHVVVPAGSGATGLGLSIAARLLDLPWVVHGICIGGTPELIRAHVSELRRVAAAALGRPDLEHAQVHVHGGSLGAGYDRPSADDLEEMRRAVVDHGLLLDPNYMVKTFRGLRALVDDGIVGPESRAVLVHTGGSLGLFGDSPVLQGWYQERLAPHLAPSSPVATPLPDGPSDHG